MHPIDDTPWNQGPKIIVAFDIGNTQVALNWPTLFCYDAATVSFAHLRPGSPPCIHTVCQWPGQQNQGGEAKVPTLTWYDSAGQARAFGAEARTFSVLDQAEDCGWCLAKNFKQHLYPRAMRGQHIVELDPLPTQVSMEQIYADFMSYLFRHTRAFFCERIIDGERSWQSLQDTIDFAITYPSQWGIVEQGLLRYAMVKAGIVPSLRASQERVHFVSEALAAAHLCLVHANPVKDLKVSDKIIICDAGESSANTTLYSVDETEPLICLREACTPSRKVTGELFVKRNAQVFFTKLFTDAGLDEESIAGYVDDALESFACEAMRSFEHDSEDKRISVGGRRFTNAQLNVRRGSLILKGTQIQKFFEPCVTEVVESVVSQLEGHMVQHVFLIGKFGESSYLRQRLNEEINRKGLKVTTISDSPSNGFPGFRKRIVDGAVIWLVRHVAATRTTRFAFGVETRIDVEPIEIPKIGRKVVPSPSGPKYEGGWAEIISKGKTLASSEEITRICFQVYTTNTPHLTDFSLLIYAYDGPESRPMFIEDKLGHMNAGFREVCSVKADLSGLSGGLTRRVGPSGVYWSLKYQVSLSFGSTALRASLMWQEGGVTCRGTPSIIPLCQIWVQMHWP